MNTNTFANIIDKQSRFGITENGADVLNNTKHAIVDLVSTAHTFRDQPNKVVKLFENVIKEEGIDDAIKLMFYIRDIKEGMGERSVFKTLLAYVANNYANDLIPYLSLISKLGRWDDYYVILEHVNKDNPAYHAVINIIRNQYESDLMNAFVRKPISLMAKWLKSINASNAHARKLAKLTAKILIGYKKDYLRIYRQNLAYLRKRLNVVETDMCSNNWNDIDYKHVPAKAMLRYKNAFNKHDGEKFKDYLENVACGKNKINAGTLFPSDIIKNIDFALMQHYYHFYNGETLNKLMSKSAIDTLNVLWKSLPNYVSGNHNALVMADVSESMSGNPINSSVGLGIYFAERNTGPFNNKLMLFASDPKIINFDDCNDLYSKVVKVSQQDIGYTTNIKKAFEYILQLAVDNNIHNDEMIQSLIIISDMQFDRISDMDMPKQTFYNKMKQLYAQHGYKLPKIVFWNVAENNNKYGCFHADSNTNNVIHIGGYSAAAFKTIFKLSEGVTPYQLVKEVINSERYSVN